MLDMTYTKAIASADALKTLGQTTVYLRDDTDFPWDKVVDCEAGAGYRLNGPTGCYFIVREAGLTLKHSVDFENRDANGRGVSLFDRDRLRNVSMKLSPAGRKAFARLLQNEVLPGVAKLTGEIRHSLQMQLDSEDCVRGLIAFAGANPSA